MSISTFLPCDLRGWVTLDDTGENDLHVLPDCVSSKRDRKVWGLLPQPLQIFHVGRCLFFSLQRTEDSFKQTLLVSWLSTCWIISSSHAPRHWEKNNKRGVELLWNNTTSSFGLMFVRFIHIKFVFQFLCARNLLAEIKCKASVSHTAEISVSQLLLCVFSPLDGENTQYPAQSAFNLRRWPADVEKPPSSRLDFYLLTKRLSVDTLA